MSKYEVRGDSTAPIWQRDVTKCYDTVEDERIYLNWRVVDTSTGRTMAVFGGGAGYLAATVFKEYIEEKNW